MKLLILFAKGFPYGDSEPFLEIETPLYKEYFDKVLLVTLRKKGEKPTRNIDDSTIEVLPDYTRSRHLPSMLSGMMRMLTDKMFYKDLKRLIFSGSFTPGRLCSLLMYAMCANNQAAKVHRWLKKHPEFDQAVLYSYWMFIPAYAAVRLNQKLGNRLYSISRAHGFDVYMERQGEGACLPFHEQLYHRLSEVAVICEDGKRYLEARYGDLGKVSIHRLGALDHQTHNPTTNRDVLRIVTCSRTVALKRLNRLVDALRLITDRPIHWTHIGGGECQQALERYAAEKLPENVTAVFTDTVPNARIYELYAQQPFHVFVNISETEGVPVSIMEAMSFHIPVIATAVGGTAELVEERKSGFLLSKDFTDEELVNRIRQIMDMPEEVYQSFRSGAREKFQREYDAVSNYRRFLSDISEKCYDIHYHSCL